MSVVKPAATIMLGRDYQGTLEVLLLKRNKALAFAGGLWVFPGGKIEPNEIATSATDLEAAKIAAVRETKEEANIEIDKTGLIFYRHWTTPAYEPRRFSTWFFFGGIQDISKEVIIDDSEIKEHQWIPPQLALDRFKLGNLAMLPPTFISLQLIRNCQSVADAQTKLRQEKPIHILPVVDAKDGNYIIMYKGDAGYNSGNAGAPGPRHRLTMNFAKKESVFEYKDCQDFLPVNGGDPFFDKI